MMMYINILLHVMYSNDGLYNSVTLDYCIVHGSSSTKMLNFTIKNNGMKLFSVFILIIVLCGMLKCEI